MTNLPVVHLTTGLPASGKSTFAKELVDASSGRVRRVNLDDLRMMLYNSDGGTRLPSHNEEAVLKIQDAAILAAVNDGVDIIVDNTHLHSRLPNRYKRLVSGRATFAVHDFTHVPLDVCLARDAVRGRAVGPDVIRNMHKRLTGSKWRLINHPMNDVPNPEPYMHTMGLPTAVLCDIDGTLAHHVARGPYDFEKVETDAVNPEVARILDRCSYDDVSGAPGDRIILLSGRQSEYREHTERWLKANGIVYDDLFMRAEGDRRSDDIVKAELFDNHVRGQFNVRFVLDDRQRVVDLWRRMGVECWQVAPGDF